MGAGHDDVRLPVGESAQHGGWKRASHRPRSPGPAQPVQGRGAGVLATAQLVIALDYSIVNVALPVIGRGARPQDRRAEPDDRGQNPLTQTAA